tara:strand:- start:153 stop:377 length:225 start_codon:yes stop_codon:yes gene_type:complete
MIDFIVTNTTLEKFSSNLPNINLSKMVNQKGVRKTIFPKTIKMHKYSALKICFLEFVETLLTHNQAFSSPQSFS